MVLDLDILLSGAFGHESMVCLRAVFDRPRTSIEFQEARGTNPIGYINDRLF